MQQVLDFTHAGDFADCILDSLDLRVVVDLTSKDDDPTIGVDRDLPFGKRPVTEQLALDLAHEAHVIEV